MKRRDFITGSGLILGGLAFARPGYSGPCAPPGLGAQGGISGPSVPCVNPPSGEAPTWVTSLPLNAWSAQGTNTMFDVRFGTPPDWGVSGSIVVVNYGGSAIAPSHGDSGWHIFAGGGHKDGFDNSLYAWDIATRTWSHLFDPSPLCPTIDDIPSGAAGDGIFDDGTPGAVHGWLNYAWLPIENRFFTGMRELDSGGGQAVMAPTWYDFDTAQWTCLTDYNPIANNSAVQFNLTVYDSIRNGVWMVTGGDGNTRSAFWNGSSWDTYTSSVSAGSHRTAAYCPDKDCIFVFSQFGGPHAIIDCSRPTTVVAPSFSGSGPAFAIEDGFRWSTNLAAFIYFDDSSGNLWTLTPPTGAISDPWIWASLGVNTSGFLGTSVAVCPLNFAVADYDDGTVLALVPQSASGLHNTIRLQ